jgi:hypothetical protein
MREEFEMKRFFGAAAVEFVTGQSIEKLAREAQDPELDLTVRSGQDLCS